MNKLLLTATGLMIGASALYLSAGGASAYRGDPNVQGPNYTAERHEAMTQVFANKDFEAWQKLMTETGRGGRMLEVVDTPEEFGKLVEMRQRRLEGDTAGADQIRAELGLGQGYGAGKQGGGRGQGMGCVR